MLVTPPQTAVGQLLALVLVLLVIAAAVGPVVIVGLEYRARRRHGHVRCRGCARSGHATDARYCKHCGAVMPGSETPA